MAGSVIARLAVTLGLDTAAFSAGARKARTEATGLQAGLGKVGGAAKLASAALIGIGAGIVLGGIQNAISGAFELASSMSEAAARIGVTVEALQELRVAANANGLSNEQLESSLGRLNVQLGDLQNGSKTAVNAFKAIGLSAEQLKGLAPDEALRVIADKIAAIKDPALQAAAAQDLFGKSYAAMLPLLKGGSAELEKAAEASRKHGQISTEDAKKLDDLADNWGEFKTQVSIAAANIIAAVIPMAQKVGAFLDNTRQAVANFREAVIALPGRVVDAIRRMVTGIESWVVGRLNAVWASVTGKIEAVRKAFYNLANAVVFHSYIPDMVDGIRDEMARLDQVMVDPVTKATAKSADAFRDMAGNIRSIMERLFPERAADLKFQAENAVLSNIADPETRFRAQLALARERGRAQAEARPGAPEGLFVDTLDDGVRKSETALERLANKARDTSVRVAKSFKDMADATLSAFDRLAGAIKGGGFLDILGAVIGLGTQLGSIGAFGKTIAGRLNRSVPGYAAGTNFHPGGLALVGERGPELVSMPRGSRVTPNGKLGGNTYYVSGNLLTPEFWAQIQQGDVQAAQGGAMLARAGDARSKKWSLA